MNVNDIVGYGFAFFLSSIGLLALVTACHIPKWTEIDRKWKLVEPESPK